MMNFSLVSINYKHAPLALRERLAVSADELPGLTRDGLEACGLEELMVLSTCNRVEFCHVTEEEQPRAPSVLDWLKTRYQSWEGELQDCAVTLDRQPALVHLFRVACGLESMVIGEPQILGQVKEGYRAAREQNSVGPYLSGLMPKVFHAAKRVRTETGVSRFPVSVSKVAVDLAGQIFDSLEDRTVMVIGAGEMAELVIVHLKKAGVRRLILTNRTFANAVSLAERYQGDAVRFEHMTSHLGTADIIISSTGAEGIIIGEEEARTAQKSRRGRPMFFIDIAVPRDVHPDVNQLSNVYCYDIDDLQAAASANHREREEEALHAQTIVEEEVEGFLRWREAGIVAPVIKALRDQFLETGIAEMDKIQGRFKHLPERDLASIQRLMDGLIKKLLHGPSTRLKQVENGADLPLLAQAVAEVFGLELPNPGKESIGDSKAITTVGEEDGDKVLRVKFPSEQGR